MARSAKTPKFNIFNSAINCFGERARPTSELWEYLGTPNKTVLELGCGKAELSLAYARENPETTFIGIDLKSDRLYKPAQTALAEKLTNIAFIQMNIRQLHEVFEPESINEIWVTFPDPQPRARGEKHRLVNEYFIKMYMELLKGGGQLHFKTDDKVLFEYALEVLDGLRIVAEDICWDVHSEEHDFNFPLTDYERKWMAEDKAIMYLNLQK